MQLLKLLQTEKNLPFNSDEEIEIQVQNFSKFNQSADDYKAMVKAAEKLD